MVKRFPSKVKCFPSKVKCFPSMVKSFPSKVKSFPSKVKSFPSMVKCFPSTVMDFFERTFVWFGSIFVDFSISGFFLKNFGGLEFQSKRISIFFHFWISFKELEWFGSEFQNSLKINKNSQKILKKFSKKFTEKKWPKIQGKKSLEKNH